MKKGLVFLLLLALLFPASLSRAQEAPATTSAMQAPEYTLPYPGLLPDNPLYSLKTIRDRIVSFLISDTLKKSEFNLLQADKRLGSGVYLLKKGKEKESLALSTISKGENYLEQAIVKTKDARREGRDTKRMIEKLDRAISKHGAVIEGLEEKASTGGKKELEGIRLRIEKFSQEVKAISIQ